MSLDRSQAGLHAGPEPRAASLVERIVDDTLVQLILLRRGRKYGRVVSNGDGHERNGLQVRCGVMRFDDDRCRDLRPEQVIEEEMSIARVRRVGRNEPEVEPGERALLLGR